MALLHEHDNHTSVTMGDIVGMKVGLARGCGVRRAESSSTAMHLLGVSAT